MVEYSSKEGERLDQIVYSYYGSLDMLESTLENNPHLLSSTTLSAGTIIQLEEQVTQIQTYTEENIKSLW